MGKSEFNYGLMTDLYQLTMAAGYFTQGMRQEATFELFTRRMPEGRGYLVTAGLEQALEYLEGLHFEEDEVEYLSNLPVFKYVDKKFFDYLRDLRFTGDVWAIPEGTLAFPNEPLLRVTAPLIEAQLVETYLLSMVNFQTLIATKGARVCTAACIDGRERAVIEFGTRRAHGPVAGALAARAAFIGGCAGTSNLEAGKRYGIPVFGTAAHSWTLAFDSELEAFEKYYRLFPDSTTLLIDTYNTTVGAEYATHLGKGVRGVRIDSGNLEKDSRLVREILDAAGMKETKIVLSGDLNEQSIARMVSEGVPADIFGVGTDLATSRDAPSLGGVYKMVERIGADGEKRYTAKFSSEKMTLPGAKQVFRIYGSDGLYAGDKIALATESAPEGSEPLLAQVMRGGARCEERIEIKRSQALARRELAKLGEQYKRLSEPAKYPVQLSEPLAVVLEQVRRDVSARSS
jgi:nicotinate phosphoribosyltransferase